MISHSAPCHLLILDDSPDDRLLYELALKKIDYKASWQILTTVAEVRAELEQIASIEKHGPTLFISDLHLQNGDDPLDIIKWLRAQPHLRRTPTILISGAFTRQEINTAYELGVHSLLTKPASHTQRLAWFQTLLQYWCRHSVS
ncbi:MAG: response regulator [Verrucomicrobiota bacterium]|nr:response regulator [Verrucomicrobiota bacterium]